MTEKHIQACRQVIINYRSLTEEGITGVMRTSGCGVYGALQILTGFGNLGSCILCKNIIEEYTWLACEHCIWTAQDSYRKKRSAYVGNMGSQYPCMQGKGCGTYQPISESHTVQQLLEAVSARANLMEQILEEIK